MRATGYGTHGQRVAKTVGAAVTHYLYDFGGNLIAETDGGTGLATAEYVALEGKPLAFTATGAIYWVHGDHLGTPQMLTDAAGAAVWDATYRSFGEATVTGALTFNLRFPGQYEDAETDLHYNYFRDYNPTTGRYIQSDPIGLQGGWNTFAYVGGNPVMRVDPRGLEGKACNGNWILIREEFLTVIPGHNYEWNGGWWDRIGDCECVWACKWCNYTVQGEVKTFGTAKHPFFDIDKPWFDGEPGACRCDRPGPSKNKPCPQYGCLGRPEEFT